MKSIAIAMTRRKSAPIVDPTIAAIFLLLLRPVDGLEGVGEVDGWVCGGVMALEVVGVGETEAVEKGRMAVVLTEDTVLLDVLVADVMGLAVAGFAVTLDGIVRMLAPEQQIWSDEIRCPRCVDNIEVIESRERINLRV